MAKREDLFKKFGPILTEAVLTVQLQEANRVRSWLGKPQITKQDLLDELNNALSDLEPYSWMNEVEH